MPVYQVVDDVTRAPVRRVALDSPRGLYAVSVLAVLLCGGIIAALVLLIGPQRRIARLVGVTRPIQGIVAAASVDEISKITADIGSTLQQAVVVSNTAATNIQATLTAAQKVPAASSGTVSNSQLAMAGVTLDGSDSGKLRFVFENDTQGGAAVVLQSNNDPVLSSEHSTGIIQASNFLLSREAAVTTGPMPNTNSPGGYFMIVDSAYGAANYGPQVWSASFLDSYGNVNISLPDN